MNKEKKEQGRHAGGGVLDMPSSLFYLVSGILI